MTAPALPLAHRGGFLGGLLVGIGLASLLAVSMAAGSRSHNPSRVLAALTERGVPIDQRIMRVPAAVRRNILCTALNVLMESRGEPVVGQVAVAWVTRTRADERDVNACGVVFEHLGAAQFSWTVYPIRRIVDAALRDREGFDLAQDIAWRVLVEAEADPTRGANHFWGHRAIRPPPWSRLAVPGSKVVIGGHTFIRIAPRLRRIQVPVHNPVVPAVAP